MATDKSKEAMKLALEALKQIDEAMPFPVAKLAQQVIREALAEQPAPTAIPPDANPIEWKDAAWKVWKLARTGNNTIPSHWLDAMRDLAISVAPQPAQHPKAKAIAECLAVLRPAVKGKFPHEQALEELVGYIAAPQPAQQFTEDAPADCKRLAEHGAPICGRCHMGPCKYTTPQAQPAREWVGLSEEDREQHRNDWYSNIHDKEFRAIEAKLKEKNT